MSVYKKKKSNMLEWFLPFFPVLHQYQFGFFSLGTVGLCIIAIRPLLDKNVKLSFPKQWNGFLAFFMFVLIRDIFRLFAGCDDISVQMNRIIEYVFVALIVFIVSAKEIDFDNLYKWFKIAGLIYTAGMLYHAFLIFVLHQTVHWITIIPQYALRGDTIVELKRPTAFFVEPAGIVLGLIFLLAFSLQRKEYIWAIIASLGMAISTSSVAVIITLVAWTIAIFSTNLSFEKKAFVVLLFSVLIYMFFHLDIFTESMTKLLAVLGGGSTVGSRLIGGFEVVSTLSPLELILGSNYNDIRAYMADRISLFPTDSIAVLYYDAQGNVFLNTVANIFFHYGALGVLFYYMPLLRLLQRSQEKILISCFVVLSVGQSLLLSPSYFMWLCIMLFIAKGKCNIAVRRQGIEACGLYKAA